MRTNWHRLLYEKSVITFTNPHFLIVRFPREVYNNPDAAYKRWIASNIFRYHSGYPYHRRYSHYSRYPRINILVFRKKRENHHEYK